MRGRGKGKHRNADGSHSKCEQSYKVTQKGGRAEDCRRKPLESSREKGRVGMAGWRKEGKRIELKHSSPLPGIRGSTFKESAWRSSHFFGQECKGFWTRLKPTFSADGEFSDSYLKPQKSHQKQNYFQAFEVFLLHSSLSFQCLPKNLLLSTTFILQPLPAIFLPSLLAFPTHPKNNLWAKHSQV